MPKLHTNTDDLVECENARCEAVFPLSSATTWSDPGGVHIFCSPACEEEDTDEGVYRLYG